MQCSTREQKENKLIIKLLVWYQLVSGDFFLWQARLLLFVNNSDIKSLCDRCCNQNHSVHSFHFYYGDQSPAFYYLMIFFCSGFSLVSTSGILSDIIIVFDNSDIKTPIETGIVVYLFCIFILKINKQPLLSDEIFLQLGFFLKYLNFII